MFRAGSAPEICASDTSTVTFKQEEENKHRNPTAESKYKICFTNADSRKENHAFVRAAGGL